MPLGAVQGRGPPGEPPLPPCAALGLGAAQGRDRRPPSAAHPGFGFPAAGWAAGIAPADAIRDSEPAPRVFRVGLP